MEEAESQKENPAYAGKGEFCPVIEEERDMDRELIIEIVRHVPLGLGIIGCLLGIIALIRLYRR